MLSKKLKVLAVGALSASMLCGSCVSAEPAIAKYKASSNLNIRSAPDGEVIGKYQAGESVTIVSYDPEWSQTDRGYVSTRYLSLDYGDGERSAQPEYYCDGIDFEPRETVNNGASFDEKVAAFDSEFRYADVKVKTDSIFVTSNEHWYRSGHFYLTHILTRDPGQIHQALSYDDWGGTRELVTDLARRKDAVVAINGSYFSYDTGSPIGGECYVSGSQAQTGGYTNGSEVCVGSDGRLFTPQRGISAYDMVSQGVTGNFSTADPLLIEFGEKQDISDRNYKEPYPRSAVGMIEPGEYYLITAGTSNYAGGLSYMDMQDLFYKLGCQYARSLDGGGSAALVINGQLINTPATGEERPVVDMLYFTGS